ncbi:MAG: 6-phosphofructokinase, partial [Spirochaetaceae bacterium]|nr:6-phosphofructokinase [Spirochaetaceae bacterium]
MEKTSFAIENLGPCKVLSPINLSTVEGDFRANYVKPNQCIRYDLDESRDEHSKTLKSGRDPILLEKAGPRELIYFSPQHVNAGICTCGGLCPGLNDVIRAVVRCLYSRYGVTRIRGVRYGFKGFLSDQNFGTMDLTPELV